MGAMWCLDPLSVASYWVKGDRVLFSGVLDVFNRSVDPPEDESIYGYPLVHGTFSDGMLACDFSTPFAQRRDITQTNPRVTEFGLIGLWNDEVAWWG